MFATAYSGSAGGLDHYRGAGREEAPLAASLEDGKLETGVEPNGRYYSKREKLITRSAICYRDKRSNHGSHVVHHCTCLSEGMRTSLKSAELEQFHRHPIND